MAKPIRASAVVCALLSLVLLPGCGEAPSGKGAMPLITISGSTMGTYYRVTLASLPKTHRKDTVKKLINARLAKINSQMSTYIQDSEISRFNQSSSTEWFPVSPDTATVVIEALRVFQASDGAFDVTVGPLVDLWGFGPKEKERQVPDAPTIEAALRKIGSKHLHARLSPPALKKGINELQIDLSAIAKGFAVDAVAEELSAQGLENFLVDIGGEMLSNGMKGEGAPWKIGIETPTADKRGIQQILPITNLAIATSGDYRNYFENKGQRFSHEIDPRTGKSIHHPLVSVSVLHKSCMTADAWATALIVLGPEKGMELAKKAKLPVFFILTEKEGFSEMKSAGFDQHTGLP